MDRSRAAEIVGAHLGPLAERLGIPHWRIVVDYDLRDGDAEGECTWSVDYNQASIRLDPDRFDDEAGLLKVLRHELFHVVLSPYTIFRNAIAPALDADPTRAAMAESVWTHAIEQAAINLERMYGGLTSAGAGAEVPDA